MSTEQTIKAEDHYSRTAPKTTYKGQVFRTYYPYITHPSDINQRRQSLVCSLPHLLCGVVLRRQDCVNAAYQVLVMF